MTFKRLRALLAETARQLQVHRDVSGDVDIAIPSPVAISPPAVLPAAPGTDSADVARDCSDDRPCSHCHARPNRCPRPSRRRFPAKRPVILFLAANPQGTRPLDLTRECAEIQRELARLLARSGLRFEARWAVSVDDAMRHMTELDP